MSEQDLRRRLEALADNYHVRTYSFPDQRPQWADIERDLRKLLADTEGPGA